MTAWVIDVYTAEADKTPSHRCIATAATEVDALLLASQNYPNDKVVVSIGVTLPAVPGSAPIKQLW